MSARQKVRAWALSRWFVMLLAIVSVGLVVAHGFRSNGGITLLWGILLAVAFARHLQWRMRELSKRSQ